MGNLKQIADEFVGLNLGDARLDRRARVIAERIVRSPAESFPKLMATESELEATYRFFQNESVTPQELIQPHIAATVARSEKEQVLRVAHDTVTLSYSGDRGLGAANGSIFGSRAQNFSAHIALAISGDEQRAPLGVLGLELLTHPTTAQRQREHEEKRAQGNATGKWPKGKARMPISEKWGKLPTRIRSLLKAPHVIHVMDEEADDSRLIVQLIKKGHSFVIRGDHTRRIQTETGFSQTGEYLQKCQIVLCRQVRVGGRPKPLPNRKFREERDANLSIRAARVRVSPVAYEEFSLNVVEAVELEPPADEEPIQWLLYTTEPIDTPEQVVAIVDHYRARWRIEEFFKAIKTGCSIEKRQLTTFAGLTRAFALMLPIAWHLLALRTVARESPSTPASKLFSPEQLIVLRALAVERKHFLSKSPTTNEVMLAIANLGGHLKRNGPPGWITLNRGYRTLLEAQHIWTLARRNQM